EFQPHDPGVRLEEVRGEDSRSTPGIQNDLSAARRHHPEDEVPLIALDQSPHGFFKPLIIFFGPMIKDLHHAVGFSSRQFRGYRD
ncbi:MAG: hypothetical protein KAV87_26110, partial [Desulfobacteraceae bacterium]|nr:hypothetical protein [Desulfobacteraceae bacterium]